MLTKTEIEVCFMSIISIITEKGGVGKTTTAINAGSALVKKGFKVLLIDMDKQRNLTSTANITADGQYREIHRTIVDIFCELIKGRKPDYSEFVHHNDINGFDYIASDMFVDNLNSMIDDYAKTNGYNVLQRMFKDPFFQSYDYIIFDCKKSTDSFSKCQIDSSDCAIIPVEPSAYAFDAVDRIIDKIYQNNHTKIMGILINKTGQTALAKDFLSIYNDTYKELVFKTKIPQRAAQVEKTPFDGIACVNQSHNTLAEYYMALADEIIERT